MTARIDEEPVKPLRCPKCNVLIEPGLLACRLCLERSVKPVPGWIMGKTRRGSKKTSRRFREYAPKEALQ
jgi:hypothetical protein